MAPICQSDYDSGSALPWALLGRTDRRRTETPMPPASSPTTAAPDAAPTPAGWTTPERLGLLVVGAGAAGAALRAGTGSMDLGVSCPLRSIGGVPCPLCGATTSATAMLDLRLVDALAANPFLPLLALAAALIVTVAVGRRLDLVAPARRWSPTTVDRAIGLASLLVAASWAWQLHRFGIL
jgi:hypothetical protein